MGVLSTILAGLATATKLANAAADIAMRLEKGDLTEDEARQEWEATRQAFNRGASAWDAAGK